MARVFFGRKKPILKEIVYAAGLFDGEGSINVARYGEMAARIQMGDKACLERLYAAFKGTFTVEYRDSRRCKNGRERKVMYQLVFNGYEALWFIALIVKELRNPRQIKRIKWLLRHWYDYAVSKRVEERNKPPRWQMYVDFHTACPSGNLRQPLTRYRDAAFMKKRIERKNAYRRKYYRLSKIKKKRPCS